MKGELITVYVLYCGSEPEGCFLSSAQAHGYRENEIREESQQHYHIHSRSGFRPDAESGDGRVFLMGDNFGPFELHIDYEPEEVRKERAAYRAAWERLSPEDRAILRLRNPV